MVEAAGIAAAAKRAAKAAAVDGDEERNTNHRRRTDAGRDTVRWAQSVASVLSHFLRLS